MTDLAPKIPAVRLSTFSEDRLAAVMAERDAALAENARMREALKKGEAALADIGDAEREPGDDVAWCEARAAEALPIVRKALGETP